MSAEPCREWRGALGAAALGPLPNADRVALDAHLDGCAACRAELDALTGVADALVAADPDRLGDRDVDPASGLGERILERVRTERARAAGRRRRQIGLRVAGVAAALAAMVAIAAVVVRDDTPDGTRVALDGVTIADASGVATMRAIEEGTEVRLHADGLRDGAWYWLWLTGDDGRKVTAGTFLGRGEEPVDAELTAALGLSDCERIWVTDGDEAVVLDAWRDADGVWSTR